MVPSFTPIEQRLLDIVQTDFPLTARPYQAIGQRLGLSEQAVLTALAALKRRRVIRQISAIFLGDALGFQTALISFRIPEPQVEQAAAIINAHPGVSHNYLRAHVWNLWFTLSVPQELAMQAHIRALAELTGSAHALYLPARKTFKRQVQFAMSSAAARPALPSALRPSAKMSRKIPLSDDARAGIMAALQHDLPLTATPFADLARRFGIDDETVCALIADLQTSGAISRFAAILGHRRLGYTANAMVAWQVPATQVDEFGRHCAEHPAISHCYERAAYPEDWPYNLYTMIHATTNQGIQAVIAAIRARFPATPCERLDSVREFKKQRVNFFDRAIHAWQRQWIG
jgi:siroheme decarboxylase